MKALSRRAFLHALAAGGGAAALSACGSPSNSSKPPTSTTPLLRVGEPPNPRAALGTDLLPQVDHIVVVMMENHSFDNMLGTLGRGDGLTIGAGGLPTNSNPNGKGGSVRSFHMPTPCQLHGQPSQSWNASHTQYDNGTNQGFVVSASGPVAMGYWNPPEMPFTASLARTFPLADRWFCSVLAQTFPNRRYLMAGTSLGLVDDSLETKLPPHGTIFNQLNRHGISWKNYFSTLPSAGIWVGLLGDSAITSNLVATEHFFTDCAAGTLPAFSLVDPNFDGNSEENPQDIQYGDAFLASVVNAIMHGPKWSKTLLLWTYDEHGGYYDHVPPPAAPEPDNVPPSLRPGEIPGRFDRFGFRVPSGLVSPYALRDHVSHTVYDHTSVLKLIETKWNLPTLTKRDAAANNVLDMVDFGSSPAFLHPPTLAAPANPALRAACLKTGPGVIPPASAVSGA
jgi:phospholipase C